MAWRWAAASEIGSSHLRLGTRKQDAMSCFLTGSGALCAIVCDGAGSAPFGGEGASVLVRTLSESLRAHFRVGRVLPEDDDVWSWVDSARDRLAMAAEQRETTRRAFASTLVMLVATGNKILTAHIGDGAIVARTGAAWETISPPENGEFASTTYFATDDPMPRLRLERHEGEWTGFAVFSDGIENLVLDHRNDAPHEPFFNTMIAPVDALNEPGKDAKLSSALAAFLRGPKVCDKTDDDKTLLLLSSR
ncbi:PP2C family serine/threonine-protein phosphatase [Porphyrobacter sp. MBR-155]|uniref:PP2C family serine/threonine-protein phosphatase n=1 Tax=Porphyrobacter sp. MBR-155 TaxID=3156464 RepID=UPI00339389A1